MMHFMFFFMLFIGAMAAVLPRDWIDLPPAFELESSPTTDFLGAPAVDSFESLTLPLPFPDYSPSEIPSVSDGSDLAQIELFDPTEPLEVIDNFFAASPSDVSPPPAVDLPELLEFNMPAVSESDFPPSDVSPPAAVKFFEPVDFSVPVITESDILDFISKNNLEKFTTTDRSFEDLGDVRISDFSDYEFLCDNPEFFALDAAAPPLTNWEGHNVYLPYNPESDLVPNGPNDIHILAAKQAGNKAVKDAEAVLSRYNRLRVCHWLKPIVNLDHMFSIETQPGVDYPGHEVLIPDIELENAAAIVKMLKPEAESIIENSRADTRTNVDKITDATRQLMLSTWTLRFAMDADILAHTLPEPKMPPPPSTTRE
ncbi:hypothetical protein FPQ18DRAFT_398780 [Pyronema domesticum]|nr:hypothetical protein FPQ18DRAFT_398780 [Pyronema domesticum]